MSLFARRHDYSLTEREIAEKVRPYGQGIQARPVNGAPDPAKYVASPGDLEAELNEAQAHTLAQMRRNHDEVEPERILECGTCWVIATDYIGNGGQQRTHHIISYPEGIPI